MIARNYIKKNCSGARTYNTTYLSEKVSIPERQVENISLSLNPRTLQEKLYDLLILLWHSETKCSQLPNFIKKKLKCWHVDTEKNSRDLIGAFVTS